MLDLLEVGAVRRWLTDVGVSQAIVGIADYIEQDFHRWEVFDKTPRVASHSQTGVIELMPVSDHQQYGFKYVNGHPTNPSRGLQTVTAFGALADVATGYPLLLSEMTILTALRTAATAALAARILARPESSTLALIGTGSQSEFQAVASRALLGVDTVRVWDIDPDAMRKFETNLSGQEMKIERAHSVAEAVAGADIVTTCTADKTNAVVLRPENVEPGMHINALGGDCPGKTELDRRIVEAAHVFVEYEPQSRIEGEIQHMPIDFAVTELWQVMSGGAPGRTSTSEVTVFDSVGFAIEDFSALRYVYDSVRGTDYVRSIDLVAEPNDPKDLWCLVHP